MAFLVPDNLKSRRDIPDMMRRVAKAFEIGLDPATVWFEPPFDPTGEKPHYVVLLPDRGIAVLEILEARSEKLLGVLRGKLRLKRDGQEVEAQSPLVRAEKLKETLAQRVQGEKRLRRPIPVVAGAVFADTTTDEAKKLGLETAVAVQRAIFKEHLQRAIDGEGEADLQRVFAAMFGGALDPELSDEESTVARGLIQPETVIDRGPEERDGKQISIFRTPEGVDDIVRVMDLKQEAMVKSLGDGHRVVRGVAGSGKTLVLVYRASLMARLFPNKKFLVTCYTKSLVGQLKLFLHEHPNVEVMNIDKVLFRVMKDAGLKMSYDEEDATEKAAGTALRQALPKVAKPRYHGIFIDEAQDLGANTLKFALGLLEPGSDDVLVVADAAQNIFRRKFHWKDAGIQAQGRTRILRVNYRNTREILDFAYKFLTAGTVRPDDSPDMEDENAVIPPEAAKRTGPSPVVVVATDAKEELAKVVELAAKAVVARKAPRQVAVLYASSRSENGSMAARLHDELKEKGVSLFWATRPGDRRGKERLGEAENPVILSTIHSAKGLEFPHVILCGLWNDREDSESNRKLAYVGMTRATHKLEIVLSKDNPLASDVQGASA